MKRKRLLTILTISAILTISIVSVLAYTQGWLGGTNAPSVPPDTFTRGLVGYWSFDEGNGLTAYDASGNGNNGTLVNGPEWVKGKSGSALSFDGSNDYVDVASISMDGSHTLEAWVRPNFNELDSVTHGIIGWNNGTDYIAIGYHDDINGWRFLWNSQGIWAAAQKSTTITPGVWYHLVGIFDSETGLLYLYLNGELVAQSSGAVSPSTTPALLRIGAWSDYGNYWNGTIDEVRIYNRALSAEEIRYHYNRGGPVAYWKFDEGEGSTVYDSSNNSNNGTLNLGTSGNTSTSAAWVKGKYGSALSFDGVDDYVDVGNDESLDVDPPFTIEMWIKPSLIANQAIYGGFNSLGYTKNYVSISSDGKISLDQYPPSGGSISSKIVLSANTWYNIVVIQTNSSRAIYINGNLDNSDNAPETYSGSAVEKWVIGYRWGYQYHLPFKGIIDEVRIYNYARTPDEIRLDYNAGYAARFGPKTSCSENPGACMDYGLVGYWSFDEGTGDTAYDASGNGNNGTIYGAKWSSETAPAPLNAGGSLQFDGVDDYVEVPNSPSLDITNTITLEAWVKWFSFPSTDAIIVSKNKEPDQVNYPYYMGQWNGIPYFRITTASGPYTLNFKSMETNKWYHMVGVYDGIRMYAYLNGELNGTLEVNEPIISSTKNLYIGAFSPSGRFFNGLTDEVRIYNRALSPEEIRYHYNHTLPKGALSSTAMESDPSLVGYWSFNEGKGTIAHDDSGNSNNGTIYGATWVPGKSGTALSFDGSGDYVDLPDNFPNVTDFTFEGWVYWQIDSNWQRIFDFGQNTSYNMFLTPGAYGAGLRFAITTAGSGGEQRLNASRLNTGTWYHIAVVLDGDVGKLYVNGVLEDTQTITLNPSNVVGTNTWLGKSQYAADPYFHGLIDEVRIYNRALTAQEIQQHYRESKYYLASHFGPHTNCSKDPGSCMDYGLVGYWNFDEGTDDTAYDASGNGNNGTIHGAKWTQGKSGPALSFDGVDDYVEVPHSESLTMAGDFTLEVWVYREAVGSDVYEGVIRKGLNYVLHILPTASGPVQFVFYDGTNWQATTWTEATNLNEWHHIAVTWNDASKVAKVFLDGVLKGEKSFTTEPVTDTSSLLIGAESGPVRFFNGLIDEVRIYNRALSAEEIRYHYNRGGPVAYWKFDEGEGSTVYDSSINSNNGTLSLGTSGNTSTSAAWVKGKYGSALSFDGVDDYVEATVSQTKTTYSLWIKPASTGVWEHIEKVNSTYYVNGVPGTPTAFPIYVSGDTVQIGKTSATTYFNGIIDDVRIYNYERSKAQIRQDYNMGLSTHFR